jgi:hypothetical protein
LPNPIEGEAVPQILSRHQWIDELVKLCPFISSLNLKKGKDAAYMSRSGGQNVFQDADAYNLSNSAPHNQIIVESVNALRARTSDDVIRNLLGEVTFRNTYGAFSELAAYKWLADAGVDFMPQVAMAASDVLNPNGSIIDGEMTLPNNKQIFFDIKGFGFHAHKIKILNDRLEKSFVGKSILIEGAWDVSVESLQELMDHKGFTELVAELKLGSTVRRGLLELRIQDLRPVTVSAHSADPHKLAYENRDYPQRFAGQYTRNAPFILFFVIHPWFSQGELHQNFGGFVDIFTRELSRLAFLSFQNDQAPVAGVPRSDAAKLLSGLAFLNVWPKAGTDAPRPRPACRIYLNPIATNPLEHSNFSAIQRALGDDLVVERIYGDKRARLKSIVIAVVLVISVVGLLFVMLGN